MSKMQVKTFGQRQEFDLDESGNCFAFIVNFIIIGTRTGELFRFNSILNKVDKENHDRKNNVIECICTLSNQEFSLGCCKSIYIYNISLECTKTLNAHSDTITSLKVSNSTLYSSSSDTSILAWNLLDSSFSSLDTHNYPITTMDLSTESHHIAASDTDLNLSLYSFRKNCLLAKIENSSQGIIWCLKFIKKGEFLISGDNESFVIIRKIKTFNEIFKQIRPFHSRVKDICFSHTKNLIACCGFDKQLCFISLNKLQVEKCFEEEDWIRAVGFNQDQSKVITIADDRKIRYYDVGAGNFEEKMKFDVRVNLIFNLIISVLVGLWMALELRYSIVFILSICLAIAFGIFICVTSIRQMEKESICLKICLVANLVIGVGTGLIFIFGHESMIIN